MSPESAALVAWLGALTLRVGDGVVSGVDVGVGIVVSLGVGEGDTVADAGDGGGVPLAMPEPAVELQAPRRAARTTKVGNVVRCRVVRNIEAPFSEYDSPQIRPWSGNLRTGHGRLSINFQSPVHARRKSRLRTRERRATVREEAARRERLQMRMLASITATYALGSRARLPNSALKRRSRLSTHRPNGVTRRSAGGANRPCGPWLSSALNLGRSHCHIPAGDAPRPEHLRTYDPMGQRESVSTVPRSTCPDGETTGGKNDSSRAAHRLS